VIEPNIAEQHVQVRAVGKLDLGFDDLGEQKRQSAAFHSTSTIA
jgi:hypothetical protein